MLLKVIYPLLFMLMSINLYSQLAIMPPDYAEKLEVFFKETLEQFATVPGISVAVIKGDQVLYQGGFGLANVEKQEPMRANTDFYIASCTKSFTALLAVLLDEEGVLDLDQSLAETLPDIQFPASISADKVLLRDLLTHTSGLDHPSIGFRLAYTGDHNHQLLMDQLPFLEPNKTGRNNYQYTNLGYNIYTLILEEKTGKPWQDWLEEKIFDPLGMNHTTAYMSRAAEQQWPLALPYLGLEDGRPEAVYLLKKDNTMQSAGGLIITAADAGRWLRMQVQHGKLGEQQIFKQKIIQSTREEAVSASARRDAFEMKQYGLGWSIGTFKDHQVIWHSGGFPGYLSTISFLPEEEIGVAVFVNDGMLGGRLMYLLTNYAYDAYLQPEGWEAHYQEARQQLKEQWSKARERMKADREKRSERKWQLTESFERYTGTFSNELLGTFKVELVGSKQLKVSMGNMHCIATPFTKKNTIRLEMVPGSGEVLEFEVENKTVVAARLDDIIFTKQ